MLTLRSSINSIACSGDFFRYLWLSLVFSFAFVCQNSLSAQTDSWGREFFVSLFENLGDNQKLFLHFYSEGPTTADVTYGTGSPITYDLPGGEVTIEVPQAYIPRVTATSNFVINQKSSAHIVSNDKIRVSFSNSARFSTDATAAIPATAGGHHYIVPNWYEPPLGALPPENAARILIINTGGRTVVSMVPKSNMPGWPAGEQRGYMLEQGDVFSISGAADLTGFEIKASIDLGLVDWPGPPPPPPPPDFFDDLDCHSLIVYYGNQQSWAGLCSALPPSHMVEALPPISASGNEFLVAPFRGRLTPRHTFFAMAMEDNTTLTYESPLQSATLTLNKGEKTSSFYSNYPYVLRSDKPLSVNQQALVQDGCDPFNPIPPGSTIGSPFSLNHSSFEQAIERTKIHISELSEIDDYYLNIMIRTSDVSKFSISPPVSGLNFQEVASTGLSYVQVEVSPNTEYTLEAPDGEFLVTEYGFGGGSSYGKNPYQEVNNLNFEISIDDEQIGDVVDDACLNSVLSFDVDFLKPGLDTRYTEISWDFGDGETYEGRSFDKTYDAAGVYRISCTLSTGSTDCETIHTLYREIEVHEIVAERIEGPISLCPFSAGIVYELINEGGYIYDWEVEGGTIVGSDTGESITVNWQDINDNAKVTVYVSDIYGCAVEPIELNVKLESNDELQPGVPFGNAEVCFTDRDYQVYYTPTIPAADFEWVVEGGSIISGQGTNEIVVDWTDMTGSIYYILTVMGCYGSSPPIDVQVYEELIPTVDAVSISCNGFNDGQASVSIEGGKLPYTIRWSTGSDQNSIAALRPGNYSIEVEDGMGCVKQLDFEIEEPDVLNAQVFTRKYCHGEADGEVSIIPTGGTAPYSYRLFGSTSGNTYDETSSSPEFRQLLAGRYTLIVEDAKGCQYSETVDIDDNPLLELTVLANRPVCPGESNGSINILATGGVGPYTYSWDSEAGNNTTLLENVGRGSYIARVTDSNGCSATRTIVKDEMVPRMVFPNSFSPNGDGINDLFEPLSPCIPDYDLYIYDRWGKVVFQEINGKGKWDGTTDGEPMPSEVYVYKVNYDNITPNGVIRESIRGYIRLIR